MQQLTLEVSPTIGAVSALLQRPADADRLIALAHGAGAGMRHRFMDAVADRLAARRFAVLRYQFPYMEKGQRRPDRPAVLQEAVRAAVRLAGELADGLPVIAGGKSLGGRMTTSAAAAAALPGVTGIALLGFPLHPSREPGVARAAHLGDVSVPMLFLQGTRDPLADLEL
ncbi:MAG: alpha/beta hydrolase family protein, partial [Planctomycetota bacterium]